MKMSEERSKGFEKLKNILISRFPDLVNLKRVNRMEGRYDGIHHPKFTTYYYNGNNVWFIENDDRMDVSEKWVVNDELESFYAPMSNTDIFEKLIKDICDIDLLDKGSKKWDWVFDDFSEVAVPRKNIR